MKRVRVHLLAVIVAGLIASGCQRSEQQPASATTPGGGQSSAAPPAANPTASNASNAGTEPVSKPKSTPATTTVNKKAATAAVNSGSSAASTSAGAPAAPAPATMAADNAPSGKTPVTTTRVPQEITIPAGTVVKVRTVHALSSNANQVGDAWEGTLETPLTANGVVIAPKGATVEGKVVDVDKGGRVKGTAHLTLALQHVHTPADGELELSSERVTIEASSSKSKDAAKIAIGTGIGA